MGIGLREWLAIIGVIIILLIMVDGFRRYFGRSSLQFKLDRKLINQFTEETDSTDVLSPVRVVEPKEPSVGDFDPASDDAEPRMTDFGSNAEADEPLAAEPVTNQAPVTAQPSEPAPAAEQAAAEVETVPPVEEIFIVYVETADQEGFKGPALLQCILESGMRFGDMDIFHRHESMSGTGDKLFSMANALKPGTFDLDDIEGFSTRSVCFFMSLPGPKQPKQALELMLTAARKLANELGGELKDDHRSDLTGQTTEHYRQRVIDFERRQLSVKH